MTLSSAFVKLLVFPGVLYAVPAAWLMEWLYRKVVARAQRRIGPPFYQPFFDFVKLLSKEPVGRPALQGFLMTALPLVAVAASLGTISLLPVFLRGGGFAGDLVLLVSLIELVPLCFVLAGFVSRSLFGGIGAAREAVLTLSYNVPFLMALFALVVGVGSFSLGSIAATPMWLVRVPALLALLMTLPVKLHLNPFSAADAEQEIYAGALTEFDGQRLALWKLAHVLEWVALTGLWTALAFPMAGIAAPMRALLFVVVSFALVVLLALVSAATARLKTAQIARFYWIWGLGVAVVALVAALIGL
jgi:NADH-quinone oxidoreductase subunit H